MVVADIPRHCRFAANLPDGARGHLRQVRTLSAKVNAYDILELRAICGAVCSGEGRGIVWELVTNFHAVMRVDGVDVIACLRPLF